MLAEHRRYTWQSTAWLVIAVVSAITLGAVFAFGITNGSTARHIDKNGALSIDQAKRTECRSVRAAALDKARWDIVFDLLGTASPATTQQLAAASDAGKHLPAIDRLVDQGGTVAGRHFPACPPSIARRTS